MTVSRLGFEVDSSQAAGGAVDLDKLTQSAERAERAERGLAASSKSTDTATGQLARSTRDTATATSQLERATDMVSAAQGRAVVTTNATTAALNAQAVATQRNAMMTRQLMYQLVDVGQSVPLLLMSPIHGLQNLGFQVAQIGQLYYGQGGMRAALRDMTSMVGRFAARLAPVGLAVGAVATALAGMTSAINETSDVTVGFGDVALATFQVIRDGIYDFVRPAIEAVAPWFATAWDVVVTATKTMGNNLVRLVLGSFEIIKAGVMNLPDAFIVAGQAAANGFLAGMEFMVREALAAINSVLTSINGVLPEGMALPLAPAPMSVSLGRVDLGAGAAQGRINERLAGADAAVSGIVGTDYLGQFFDAVSVRATENALRDVEEAAGSAGGAMKKAAEGSKPAWEEIADEIRNTQKMLGEDFGGIMKGLIDGTLDWRDAIVQAGQALLRYLDQMAQTMGGTGLFGGGFFQGLLGALLGFEKGGAFDQGNVIPFARGGIVSRPTLFPMANGAGLMGEAGPEAIMPLRRGPDGRLGVSAGRQAANDQPLKLKIVSRFDADGGFDSAVERASRPVAVEESTRAAGQVAKAVPSMSFQTMEENRIRRIRPRSAF